MAFGILNKEWSNFKETVIYLLVGIKIFEISAYFENRIFTRNVNNFETLRQIFLLLQQISLRALLFHNCKFEVELAAQLTLKCKANTFVNVDARKEENC